MPRAAPPTRRGLLRGAGLGLGAALLTGGRAAAEARTLRLGHALPAAHPVHRAMANFADVVARRTSDEINIRLYADGLIGQEPDLLEQLRAGTLDLAKLSASILDRLEPRCQIFNVPFLIRDKDHYRRIAEGAIGSELLSGLPVSGVVGLTFYDAGARSFYGQRSILHPSDLKGLRLRVQPSPSNIRMIELLEAEPKPLPWAIVFTALQTGLIDGAENNPTALVYGRHNEVVRYYSYTEHTFVPDLLLMSARSWNRMTPPQREILLDAARGSALVQSGVWEAAEQESRRRSEALGVVFQQPDKPAFAERLAPMRREFGERFGIGRLIAAADEA